MYFRSYNNANMKTFDSWKRMLQATIEAFCKIDPPLVSDQS